MRRGAHFMPADPMRARSLADISARLPEKRFSEFEQNAAYDLSVAGSIEMTATGAASIDAQSDADITAGRNASVSARQTLNVTSDKLLALRSETVTISAEHKACAEDRVDGNRSDAGRAAGRRQEHAPPRQADEACR